MWPNRCNQEIPGIASEMPRNGRLHTYKGEIEDILIRINASISTVEGIAIPRASLKPLNI
jgi:hypothetical protein